MNPRGWRKRRWLLVEVCGVMVALAVLYAQVVPLFLQHQSINTPRHFPDPNFRAAVERFMEVEPGGHFTRSEAAERSGALDCMNREIQNLDGIEYFPRITGLHCSRNRLTKLDVSTNTKLETLDCSENALTTLDLSHNPNLTGLWCDGNRMPMPDLSHNRALTVLNGTTYR